MPPEPWHSFFREINEALEQSVVLHCLGGFVIAMQFGFARETRDVDCISLRPFDQIADLQERAGIGSALHRKHGVYLQYVAIVNVPEDYAERVTEMFPAAYSRLRLFALEAHDLALSKLERNSAQDREDVRYLRHAVPLDLRLLEDRYRKELRPYLANVERHDLTLRLWLEMLQ